MTFSLDELTTQRRALLDQILALPVFRRGTVLARHRSCGKAGCCCQKQKTSSHLQYQWSVSIHGKTRSKNLHLGPEVEKYLHETDTYRTFVALMEQFVCLNEQIADQTHPAPVESETELDTLKKKLRTQLSKPQKKKSSV